ncbi:MAG: hypothetical protein HC788_00240 [Sphingopyxis sp.]|nr:hypothetical protein [Sphingopyxis sp.]
MEQLRQIEDQARRLAGRIAEAVGNAGNMRDAAQSIAASWGQMTTASEQMSASIQHIAEQTEQSRQATAQAREQATVAGELADQSIEGTARIAHVVESISEVARITRYLALNAGIEASRASGTGIGFTVIAEEVKQLAERTRQLSSDAAALLTSVSGHADNTRIAVQLLVKQVMKLDTVNSEISGAVQQQSKVASEVTASLASSMQDLQRVSAGVAKVAEAATINQNLAVDIAGGIKCAISLETSE